MSGAFQQQNFNSSFEARRPDAGTGDGGARRNPAMSAAHDLALKWDQVIGEMNDLRTRADLYLAENIQLAEQLEGAKRELADRVKFLSSELKRQTDRSDSYQNAALRLRLKFEALAEALITALKQDFPDRRPGAGRSSSAADAAEQRRRARTPEVADDAHLAPLSPIDYGSQDAADQMERRKPGNPFVKRVSLEREFSSLFPPRVKSEAQLVPDQEPFDRYQITGDERRTEAHAQLKTSPFDDDVEGDVAEIVDLIGRLTPNGGLSDEEPVRSVADEPSRS